jgi:hypothetical protein
MNSVWVQRTPQQLMDTWGTRPTQVIHSLSELEALF